MGSIVTFYSFKGGVGRTMALANVAVLLARSGKRVLAVDWDLEAPGLDRYFREFGSEPRIGLIDLLSTARDSIARPDWRDYVTTLEVGGTPLQLIASGRPDDTYASKVLSFDWSSFFKENDGGRFIEDLRAAWALSYDVVLIDSRTGITDSGGVCTIQLPDVIVPVFTSNDQSLEGIKDVVMRAQRARRQSSFDRPRLLVFPLLSRFDGRVEYGIGQVWLTRFANELAPFYADWLPKRYSPRQMIERTKLPYVPIFSFGEKLPVLIETITDPDSISFAYAAAATLIAEDFGNVDALLGPQSSPVVAEIEQQELKLEIARVSTRLSSSRLYGIISTAVALISLGIIFGTKGCDYAHPPPPIPLAAPENDQSASPAFSARPNVLAPKLPVRRPVATPGMIRLTVRNGTQDAEMPTGVAMTGVYVSPSDVETWGANRSARDVPPGGDVPIVLSATNCFNDIRVVFADSHRNEHHNFDACRYLAVDFGHGRIPISKALNPRKGEVENVEGGTPAANLGPSEIRIGKERVRATVSRSGRKWTVSLRNVGPDSVFATLEFLDCDDLAQCGKLEIAELLPVTRPTDGSHDQRFTYWSGSRSPFHYTVTAAP